MPAIRLKIYFKVLKGRNSVEILQLQTDLLIKLSIFESEEMPSFTETDLAATTNDFIALSLTVSLEFISSLPSPPPLSPFTEIKQRKNAARFLSEYPRGARIAVAFFAKPTFDFCRFLSVSEPRVLHRALR